MVSYFLSFLPSPLLTSVTSCKCLLVAMLEIWTLLSGDCPWAKLTGYQVSKCSESLIGKDLRLADLKAIGQWLKTSLIGTVPSGDTTFLWHQDRHLLVVMLNSTKSIRIIRTQCRCTEPVCWDTGRRSQSNEARILVDSCCIVRVTEAMESGEPPNSRCGAFTIAIKGSMWVGGVIEAVVNSNRRIRVRYGCGSLYTPRKCQQSSLPWSGEICV